MGGGSGMTHWGWPSWWDTCNFTAFSNALLSGLQRAWSRLYLFTPSCLSFSWAVHSIRAHTPRSGRCVTVYQSNKLRVVTWNHQVKGSRWWWRISPPDSFNLSFSPRWIGVTIVTCTPSPSFFLSDSPETRWERSHEVVHRSLWHHNLEYTCSFKSLVSDRSDDYWEDYCFQSQNVYSTSSFGNNGCGLLEKASLGEWSSQTAANEHVGFRRRQFPWIYTPAAWQVKASCHLPTTTVLF